MQKTPANAGIFYMYFFMLNLLIIMLLSCTVLLYKGFCYG